MLGCASSRAAAGMHQPHQSQTMLQRSQPGRLAACRSARHRRPLAAATAAAASALPAFIPSQFAAEIEELAAQGLMAAYQRQPVEVPSLGTVQTAYVAPDPLPASGSGNGSSSVPDGPVFVLLHGFDSSSLEFRRLLPRLQQLGEAWAVDLVGWGFTDYTPFLRDPPPPLGPTQKREHLGAFLDQVVGSGRRVVLIGTSLGGAAAIDFALSRPEAVEGLVLVDAQGFIDGIGPLASLPRWLARWGVRVLRSVWLRQAANKIAYHDQARYATDDALRIGRLHTHLPGWEEANLEFMRSGGYALSRRIRDVQVPTLVVWGRQDQILDPKYAQMFIDALPNARGLRWIEDCGHCSHLEQPAALAGAVSDFVAQLRGGSGSAAAAAKAEAAAAAGRR